jgi:predicted peptidase
MKFQFASMGLIIALTTAVQAAGLLWYEQNAQESQIRVNRTVKVKYLVYLPDNYIKKGGKLPVIVYLHGGSLRGDNVEALRTLGLPRRVEREHSFPFLVVAPLCPEGEIWTDSEAVIGVLDDVLTKYPTDRNRVYITGHSMGGRGALYIAYKFPDRFAAIVAMSAYAPINEWASRLSRIPIWYFHGVKDNLVPIADGDNLVKAIRSAGGDVKYSRLDNRDHFVLDLYDREDWAAWLLEHSR